MFSKMVGYRFTLHQSIFENEWLTTFGRLSMPCSLCKRFLTIWLNFINSISSPCFFSDRYTNSLIYPTVQPDGLVEFVGPSLANDVVKSLSWGSNWWPRSAKLAVHAFTIPRLLVSIESASLFASSLPTTQSIDDQLHRGLANVPWWSTSIAIGNGG